MIKMVGVSANPRLVSVIGENTDFMVACT